MKLLKVKKMLVLKDSYSVAWSSSELGAFKRLEKLTRGGSKMAVLDLVQRLVELKLTSFKKDLSFLLKLLKVLGWSEVELSWIRATGLAKSKKITYTKRHTVFPDTSTFQKGLSGLLADGKAQAALFVCMVISSGRRGVEVSRLKIENLSWIDEKLVGKLEWSKTSVKPVVFEMDFDQVKEWLEPVVSIGKVKDSIRAMMQENSGLMFSETIHKNLGKKLGYSLHALRTVKAVFMLRAGHSDSEIKNQLGWVDDRMLLRYVRMDPRILKTQTSMDEAMKIVMKFSQ